MPLYFKKTEKPGRALRRVGQEHLGRALSRLRQSRHPVAIHAMRKEIKRLRAILRLVPGKINRDDLRKVEKALRRVAGQLASPRDARVRFMAFEKLAGRTAARSFPQLQKALQKKCRQEARRFRGDDSAAQAGRILRKAGRRLTRLKIPADGWTAIEPGLRESYQQGRQGYELARRPWSEEHFHEWRKHVKVFWCQLRLLCPAWPAAGRVLVNKLDRLGRLLGEDHDLTLLEQFAAKHGPPAEAAGLNRRIAAQHQKLRTAAMKLGAQIYQAEPAVRCRRLGRSWNGWHSKIRK